MYLPWEHWRERTLREIARAIGTPLIIESATQYRHFGHYAKVLIDIDISKHIFDEIIVERDGFDFQVEVIYKRLSLFCSHCCIIEHNLSNCKWIHSEKEHGNPWKKPMVEEPPAAKKKLKHGGKST